MKTIITTYREPKNRRGSHIIAKDSDNNKIIFDFGHELSGDTRHQEAARALCKRMGWTGVLIQGSLGPGQEVFVWAKSPDSRQTWEIPSYLLANAIEIK